MGVRERIKRIGIRISKFFGFTKRARYIDEYVEKHQRRERKYVSNIEKQQKKSNSKGKSGKIREVKIPKAPEDVKKLTNKISEKVKKYQERVNAIDLKLRSMSPSEDVKGKVEQLEINFFAKYAQYAQYDKSLQKNGLDYRIMWKLLKEPIVKGNSSAVVPKNESFLELIRGVNKDGIDQFIEDIGKYRFRYLQKEGFLTQQFPNLQQDLRDFFDEKFRLPNSTRNIDGLETDADKLIEKINAQVAKNNLMATLPQDLSKESYETQRRVYEEKLNKWNERSKKASKLGLKSDSKPGSTFERQ